MKTIKTVNGNINPNDLGFTDIHNHVWKSGGMEVIEDKDFGIESIDKSREELLSFKKAGGDSMVDMQPIGVGRGINEMKKIANNTGVNLIAITGFHRGGLYDKAHFVHKYTEDQILDIVLSEIEKGIEINDFCGPYIEHSDVLPGLVKCGSSYYKISPLEEKLIKVAGRASAATNIPIGTHTHYGTMGFEQAELLIKSGAKPNRIMIGHMDRNADLIYHKKVLDLGVYIQYDCVARVKYHPVSETMNLIKELSELGYSNRIMIGGDWGRASYLKAYNGEPGFEYIPKYFPDMMKEYGISQEVINRIFIDNPKEFLAY